MFTMNFYGGMCGAEIAGTGNNGWCNSLVCHSWKNTYFSYSGEYPYRSMLGYTMRQGVGNYDSESSTGRPQYCDIVVGASGEEDVEMVTDYKLLTPYNNTHLSFQSANCYYLNDSSDYDTGLSPFRFTKTMKNITSETLYIKEIGIVGNIVRSRDYLVNAGVALMYRQILPNAIEVPPGKIFTVSIDLGRDPSIENQKITLTRNYYSICWALGLNHYFSYGAPSRGHLIAKLTNGVIFPQIYLDYSYIPLTISTTSYDCNEKAPKISRFSGDIIVGTGNSPTELNTYNLENQIPPSDLSGLSSGSSYAYSNDYGRLRRYSKTFKNNTEESITIKEVGIVTGVCAEVWSPPSPYSYNASWTALIYRDVLDEPVTVEPGKTVQIEIIIQSF